MGDLIKLVKHYINEKHLSKNIDCSYKKSYSLLDIANIINNLSTHKVEIDFKDNKAKNYIGTTTADLKWIGLEQGIKNTYEKLLDEAN